LRVKKAPKNAIQTSQILLFRNSVYAVIRSSQTNNQNKPFKSSRNKKPGGLHMLQNELNETSAGGLNEPDVSRSAAFISREQSLSVCLDKQEQDTV